MLNSVSLNSVAKFLIKFNLLKTSTFFGVFIYSSVVVGQCSSSSQWGTGNAPTPGQSVSLTTCAFGGEFSSITGVIANTQYISSATGGSGNYITIRQGNPSTGTIIAQGFSPLTWTSTVAGTYCQLINTNASCGTETTCHSLSVSQDGAAQWKTQWVSMDIGSPNWCAGETRTVSVTVKNNGLSTWSNAAPDINIGAKWNADPDYLVAWRVNANGLAAGATQTYNLTVTAPLTQGSENLTFDVVNEGNFWFANNSNGAGPGNAVYTSVPITISTPPVVNAGSDLTICNGQVAQLNGSSSAGLGSLVVNISGPAFMDESSWVLTNSIGTVIGSGGNYSMGSSNSIPISNSSNGPYNLYIETQGAFNDNVVNYAVTCNGTNVLNGTLNGGGTTNQNVNSCISPAIITNTWSPPLNLSNASILNPIASPSTTTTYTLTASNNGCLASDQVIVNLPITGNSLSNNGEMATCNVNQNGWVHFYHSSGRLIASINSQGQNLGNVTMTSYVDPTNALVPACDDPTNPFYMTSVLQRHWVITPTIQPTANVLVRLPFSNTEQAILSSTASTNQNGFDDILVTADMGLTKYSNGNNSNVNNSSLDNCGSGISTFHTQLSNGNIVSIPNSLYCDFAVPSFSEFWLHGSSFLSPLPTTLIDFKATCKNSINKLTWSTASEENSDNFIIEQSIDGISWNQIGIVKASGNSTQLINYSFDDANAIPGNNYYRLITEDLNGERVVSSIINSICEDYLNDSFSIFPNPNDGNTFNVAYSAQSALGESKISFLNTFGMVVYEHTISIEKGSNQFTFTDLALPAGIYSIVLSNPNIKTEHLKLEIY